MNPPSPPRQATSPARSRTRAAWIVLVSSAVAAPASGQEVEDQAARRVLGEILLVTPSPLGDEEAAGLPEGVRPQILTPERAYKLALIRGRPAGPGPAETRPATLDPEGLKEQASRLGVDDFARFRESFFADPDRGRGFRDPSADLFDLLRRAQELENARNYLAACEAAFRNLEDLLRGEVSGRARRDLDGAGASLMRGRLRLAGAIRRYRDKLDELKVELGLAPDAPVALDREGLARFRETFRKAARRFGDPHAEPGDVVRLLRQIPAPDDVVIDGRILSAGDPMQRVRVAELVSQAGRAAVENRRRTGGRPDPAGDDRLELRVRRRIRELLETQVAYQGERQRFVLLMRQKDRVLEEFLTPPGQGARSGVSILADLIDLEDQVCENADRLVSLWSTHQATRLDLYRDLGTMPYEGWASFWEQFRARAGEDKAAPGPDAAAPAPPAPRRPD